MTSNAAVSSRSLSRRRLGFTALALLLAAVLAASAAVMFTQRRVKALFRLNRICQEENYDMADFELS